MRKFIVGLALVAMTAAAHAALSGSVTSAIGSNPTVVNLDNVDQFNTSLGTLNKVTLTISGTQTALLSLHNIHEQTEQWSVSAINPAISLGFGKGEQTTADYDLSWPKLGKTVTVNPSGDTPYNTGTFKGGASAGTMEYTGADMAPFIGNGKVADLNVLFYGGWGASGMTDSDGVSVTSYSGTGNWIVSYDYTPVPEPCTMALMGLGGLVVAFRRRFSKKA